MITSLNEMLDGNKLNKENNEVYFIEELLNILIIIWLTVIQKT